MKETRRALFHIVVGTTIALLYYFNLLTTHLLFILLFTTTLVFFVYKYYKIPILHQLMLTLERKQDLRTFPGKGAIYFLIGACLAILLFDKPVAIASILVLTLGDKFAAIIGPHGTHPYINTRKNWEGIIAGIIVGTLAAQFLVPFWHALAASTAAMLAEGLDPAIGKLQLNDNFFIPLIAGTILTLLS